MSQVSSCVVDLETTNLSADFGVVLCGAIKPDGQEPVVFRADYLNPRWKRQRSDDKKVTKAIVDAMSDYDIWIIHNGAKFDLPFLRTRLLRWNLDPLPSKKLVDPVLLARNKLRMSYNSLEQIANHLGCNTKTEVKPEMWLAASLDGSTEAMDYISEHCIQDVIVLEQVISKLKHYSSNFNTYGSGF